MPVGSGGDGDVQAAFAATLVDEWVRSGVAHAVVCPGSRSTPLVLALSARSEVEVHVRLDERSAGFTALGIGKAVGRPALVVTTSGTAAAELHPAVTEADLARVPLIACTADRPPELRDVGAPQTIDQTHLFGRSVRWFADPGVPDVSARSSWRSLASRAVAEASSGAGGPGPVHLNLPFREPLVGDPAQAGGVSPGRPGGRPWHAVVSGPVPPARGSVSSLVAEGVLSPQRPGVIVAGAGAGEAAAVMNLSAILGWPVLADPRSRASEPRTRSHRDRGRDLALVTLRSGPSGSDRAPPGGALGVLGGEQLRLCLRRRWRCHRRRRSLGEVDRPRSPGDHLRPCRSDPVVRGGGEEPHYEGAILGSGWGPTRWPGRMVLGLAARRGGARDVIGGAGGR